MKRKKSRTKNRLYKAGFWWIFSYWISWLVCANFSRKWSSFWRGVKSFCDAHILFVFVSKRPNVTHQLKEKERNFATLFNIWQMERKELQLLMLEAAGAPFCSFDTQITFHTCFYQVRSPFSNKRVLWFEYWTNCCN